MEKCLKEEKRNCVFCEHLITFEECGSDNTSCNHNPFCTNREACKERQSKLPKKEVKKEERQITNDEILHLVSLAIPEAMEKLSELNLFVLNMQSISHLADPNCRNDHKQERIETYQIYQGYLNRKLSKDKELTNVTDSQLH